MEEIDLKELFLILWHRIWIIILVTILSGAVVFGFTRFLVKPKYTSSIKMYVNNSTTSKANMSSSDIAAAQSLVDTYITIIQSDTLLTDVIGRSNSLYTTGQLNKMISARSLNNTEVFQVNVTSEDPNEAQALANSIADTAPEYLSDIVTGTSVKIIDRAKFSDVPTSPNILSNTMIGLVAGFMLASGLILLVSLMDTRIKTEQDLQRITDLPILGAISDYENASSNNYGYAMSSEVI
ncbi:Wzz/FepE/Etk N-terminal domain-containing protein [Proteiniclasticum sp. QWL-01]|uniref:YveK family protein n=1 Tax=Proteiniclasticum sp. QWL-01 TaxID=3036945 RepID=UPI002410F16C|nr:Wzz/FepE/Etk N-terminal domain-containing protein [Proteiniclasticum sp. QWL-01]WFF73187.1 Wzz/FepE/Etk N-terminal domain-containing protein [Proteiniclasticum sp. QWL-01]